ncbi:uncharacterized protein LOC133913855 isoform X4 [Phragmites australis]|uniref:uncharacterized protein LOC133913855 isoform X4 n=1 Tax=Phragmites australis TaxID=29695 RepID=UPI002D7783DD|nr:uncharacterized protein LOC133913855 isoform X4 [Phragmites australis]
MRCMIQELMGMGMIGAKIMLGPSELKLELMPNEVKLEGSKNYLSWARRVEVILGGKGVEHYLEESCVEPADKFNTEWKVWHTTNYVVVAWLMASMSPIGKMVESMRSAAKIWKTLKNMYSRKGNMMMLMEIQNKVYVVKQEGRPVEEYASELKYLWGELDHYAPLQMVTPNDTQAVQKWVEDRRVIHFLKHLDHVFESRRAAFCHLDSLPTLEAVISAMVQEESRLHVMGGNNPVRSTYTTMNGRKCYSCGEKWHLSYNCPNPRNHNGGRTRIRGGRGGSRGGYGGGRGGHGGGRGRGHGGPSANVASSGEAPFIILMGEQVMQWEQWQKGKASEDSTRTSSQGPVTAAAAHFGNFANYARAGEGTQAHALASYHSHLDWIIDSGAAKHVTGEEDWEEDWDWSQA